MRELPISEDEPPSRVGTRFGPYQLRRLLGRGGMGEVYVAYDTAKDRVVAVKLISEPFSSDAVFRGRIQREAHTAGRLKEPHVVPIHNYGEIDGHLYIDMRFIEGTDLGALLTRHGALPPARAVAIVRQISAALNAAHAAGILHRDVKPENILITGDDFAYLVDFGIASATTDYHLTGTGAAVGSWNYMAPERFGGGEVTHRVDIYSLTCVLYECLTGATPFRAEDLPGLMNAHLHAPVPRPSLARPDIPTAFDEVVERGMAKDPDQRYPGAKDLAAAAQQALNVPQPRASAPHIPPPVFPSWTPLPPPPPLPPQKGNARLLLGAVATVVVAALGVVGIWLGTHHADKHPQPSRTSTATTTSPVAIVAPTQLNTLLLSVAEVNKVMGTTTIQAEGSTDTTLEDPSNAMSMEECRGALLPAQSPVYGQSGFTGVVVQALNSDSPVYFIGQAAIAYASGDQARAFVRTSADSWKACAGRTVTSTTDGQSLQMTFGDLTGAPPKIAQLQTAPPGKPYMCQHALQATSNVVLDVVACGNQITDQASRIAEAMAAKAPK